jgi:hypothetical protein
LNLDDRFGLAELGRQPLILPPQSWFSASNGASGLGLARDVGSQPRQRPPRRVVAARWSGATSTAPRDAKAAELTRLGRASASRRRMQLVLALKRRRTASPARPGLDRCSVASGSPPGAASPGGGRNSSRLALLRSATTPLPSNILVFSILLHLLALYCNYWLL